MKFKGSSVRKSGLDITPLLDIIFLVLIFFMVAATFDLNRSLKLVLPKAFSSESDISKDRIIIEVDEDGTVAVNGEETMIAELAGVIKQYEDYTTYTVYVFGDMETSYRNIVAVIDVLKIMEINAISLVTDVKDQL
jgi:biopolymer transport protein ExbD